MKKGIIYLITIVLIFSVLIGIISTVNKPKDNNSGRIKVIATIFPQYDFAKKIGGDKVDVSLLLTPGTETHSYEPTPQDIINVNKASLFIYTGENMEPWAEKIVQGIDSDTVVLDASKNIELKSSHDDEEHNEHNHDEEDNDKNNENEHHHEHEFDPHIWLDPQNAVIMVKNITEELCNIDSENTEYYKQNAEKYIQELNALDSEIQNTINESKTNKVAFGGTFAYMYFVERYNLDYVTAYDSCGEDTEPSVSNVKKVIDYINTNKLPIVFYQEHSAGKIADSIAAETGAKKLVFHTVHNVSSQELADNESYISIMKKNLENLKTALN